MMHYTLPYFGNLPIDDLQEYYDVAIEINGSTISLDLNFDEATIDVPTMEQLKSLIDDIGKYDKLNNKYILEDYNDEEGDTVRFYIEHHLEEFSQEALSGLVNFHDKAVTPEDQLLKKLKLIRVGFYPHSDENFVVFDYSIGPDITDYLIAINANKHGELDYMSMES
ncbi:DUF2004 domain-containing protein [Flavobacterium oreochromis]|uniref:DUF2004 domain-containing protein n=1 Tax=Flavobacterium oreochromis TaxID=2906078 RepID=A0ABW8P9V9_9FLAO|nr:DUF2004 domain-containing protein [Flavobacterium oreochromis]OWP75247.1 hypothetical protein BWG23_11570 [Flavobacterium oreochromis]